MSVSAVGYSADSLISAVGYTADSSISLEIWRPYIVDP
jgi:hypothetical protein